MTFSVRIAIQSSQLTPFFATENAISEMAPYAGNESHSERCSTLRVFLELPLVGNVPLTSGSEVAFEPPYMSTL